MATRKTPAKQAAGTRTPAGSAKRSAAKQSAKSAARASMSGPARASGSGALGDRLVAKLAGTDALVAEMPHNPNKPAEYGDAARTPPEGATAAPASPDVTASTASEVNASEKVGRGQPNLGTNPNNGPLDLVRTDSSERTLTTNQGVEVADNQSTLKVGLRGPALLEDFIFREKLTHFDHERIPERVVHARGSGAHGYFECYEPLTQLTRAAVFSEAGKKTPVFARFSTVAGERGSADTVRDVRGFAVKFYTDEGNWDLVGNNIPVFFIQDAIKFPDLVHAVKPEPHHQMPQASSAHDTFWDFVSLMPESTHMLLWQMSDRAIPRSFRMMQGFGVHTFRLVNAAGESRFVKFHWSPVLGTHSLDWDEAVKIAGADADFHRRDLWEAIEAGEYPEYELAIQVFTEEQADQWSFDVLDATKIVPEELVPLMPVGRMVLDRNPDNFFAETEQIAFCTANLVPGIDTSNDPLLQGRHFSYLDTQLLRLGGPNFHEIPINASQVQVHNNQRDGFHRKAINRGRVNYEPNSLAGGCPFQAGMRGFVSFPEPVAGDKMRGKPERFAEHYAQAELFWRSQSPIEQAHIVRAFRFELTRVQTPAVRERVVAQLANVAPELAEQVAAGIGIDVPEPLPLAAPKPESPEVMASPALSLFARPGDGTIRTRRIAILVAEDVAIATLRSLHEGLLEAGAVPRFVGARLGALGEGDDLIEVDTTMEAAPSVLWDALVLPDGDGALALCNEGHAVEFVKDHYRHAKPILVLGQGSALLAEAGIPDALPDGGADPGLLMHDGADSAAVLESFIAAVAQHRHFERQTDPPRV
jgi:catalase